MYNCKICQNQIDAFMDFGKMPIANGFLKHEQFSQEYFYPLKTGFCDNCATVQILVHPKPEQMFHNEYAFYSRTSKHMVDHFRNYSQYVLNEFVEDKSPFIVEIGSNDGILLENYAKRNIQHLGIEPCKNVADKASQYGVETLNEFFTLNIANQITEQYGQADALISANVMCHIPDLHEIAQAANLLLKNNGVLVFEDPYIGDIVQKTSYDQIYDEHIYFFSALSVQNIFSQHNFELIDVKPQPTHGGSMRYVLAKRGTRQVNPCVAKLVKQEKELGLDQVNTYVQFKQQCESSKSQLITLLQEIKTAGKKIVGYAATAKSSTVLNYCDINSEYIDYIIDTTPIKQNKFTPGTHIPVHPHDNFIEDSPDYALLFAWNHKDEIFIKEKKYLANGGKWIVYVPQVGIISQ